MNPTLIADNQGIPLNIMPTQAFEAWLAGQDAQARNWLEQTRFDGKGLALIPNSQGQLSQALFVADNPGHYYSCGDLLNQLPASQFCLKAESEHHKAIAFAWAIGGYRFERYKKNDKPQATLAIDDAELVTDVLNKVNAIFLIRDLVNTPAADMMPEHLGEVAEQLAERFGAQVSQLVGEQLLQENYPTIHAVGRASIHLPRLIDLRWGERTHPKVTLVGKGVCFDSGGLDLKPASGMRLMKKDMGGAAHVLGLAQLIMANNLPVCLRVLVPAVENAVAGNALRPGDVLTTRSGLTVEIDNTDAEGRLVLCDALSEAQNDNPELLIDFATLTGAMRIALGTELPGFFSSNRQVAVDLCQAGEQIDDPVWHMPLHQPYRDLFKSDIADMTNCPTIPQGGAICAALYLQSFVGDKTDWLHFDVMAYNARKLPGRPVGGEGLGIRAVFEYLQNRYCTT